MGEEKSSQDKKAVDKRSYGRLISNPAIEDYSLRYAPKNFRKWSEFTVANSAMGGGLPTWLTLR